MFTLRFYRLCATKSEIPSVAMRLCVIYPVILKLITVMRCKACNADEYDINGECCPMCSPGHHVLNHCDRIVGTRCKVCTGSTYTDVPNGLMACFTCTVCDEGNGLRVKHKCSYTSDTLCEPLTGYYCIETYGESCRKAHEHSRCLPGQYIYLNGTALMDTVCMGCPNETYSDGSLMHCKPRTNCESLGQITTTQGTPWRDAECSNKPSHLGLITGILLPVLFLAIWGQSAGSAMIQRPWSRKISLCWGNHMVGSRVV